MSYLPPINNSLFLINIIHEHNLNLHRKVSLSDSGLTIFLFYSYRITWLWIPYLIYTLLSKRENCSFVCKQVSCQMTSVNNAGKFDHFIRFCTRVSFKVRYNFKKSKRNNFQPQNLFSSFKFPEWLSEKTASESVQSIFVIWFILSYNKICLFCCCYIWLKGKPIHKHLATHSNIKNTNTKITLEKSNIKKDNH